MAHVWWRFALPWVTLALLAIIMFFNFIGSGTGKQWGIYVSTTGAVSDKYSLEITPAGWTFAIWGFIYAYQVIWILYGIYTLFRKTTSGGHLYYDPPVISPLVYAVFMVNMAINLTWVFLFDRELLWAALIFIAFIAFTLYVCIFISARDLIKHGNDLISSGNGREIWLVRFLVQNAWGMYGTWVTIATLLNLGIVMSHVGSVPQHISSTACLAILVVEAVTYFIVDNFVFDRYLRYMVTPYIVLHVALIGSLSKNWDPVKSNSILTLCILLFGASLTTVKVILMIWRHKHRPIFTASCSKVENQDSEADIQKSKTDIGQSNGDIKKSETDDQATKVYIQD